MQHLEKTNTDNKSLTMNKTLTFLFLSLSLNTYSQKPVELPTFLEGVWQAENKNLFEQWTINEHSLVGTAYKLEGGTKKITETLLIHKEKSNLIYTATVRGQNDGKGIEFTLNQKINNDSLFSFENPNHDFPQKIIYKKVNDKKIFVQVLGNSDKGFSYNMYKTIEPKVIPQWFLDDMKKNIGVWIMDNKKNISEKDKHTAYGLEYEWGIGKTSIIGTLYGIIDGKRTQDFWTFRHYWDNVNEKAIIIQYGLWGQIGIGNMLPNQHNQMEAVQTFSLPDGRTWDEKHIIEIHDNYFLSTQYNKDENGNWISNNGTSKWIKQIEE